MVAAVEDVMPEEPQEQGPDLEGLMAAQDAYEANAIGSDADSGELSLQRSLSIDAFHGKNIEPQPEGRSQVVDWTVFETIQWMLPSLCRIFAGDDKIVEFVPFGEEDEAAAEQESDYLNYQVTQKNRWFITFLTWAQDALLTKNAYCMAQMDETVRTEITLYQGQTEEQVAALLDGDDVEVVASNEYPDPNYDPEKAEPIPIGFDDLGEPVLAPAPPENFFDIEIRQTKAKQRMELRVLPPERCKVDANCTDHTLRRCDYFEFWDDPSISELRSMGFDVPDDAGDDAEFDTQEDTARDEILKLNPLRDPRQTPDPSTRRVKARYIWARHDLDGDGIAEMTFSLRIGEEIYDFDHVNRIPVSSLVPFINTHRHIGISVSDLVFDIQRIKTAILRQGLDSLYYSQNPMKAYSNKVDVDDLLVPVPGATISVDTDQPDVEGHVRNLEAPFVFPQAQDGLRHMDTVTEARVGVNRIFQGIDEGNLNHHDRIGKLSTMAAQRIEQIARIFGDGVENLFSICHELIIKSGHQPEAIKLRGEWVNFDPKQWKTGRDMRIVAPFAAGNKDSLLERLLVIKNVMSEAASAGLPMIQQDNLYNMGLEIAKAADLSGEKFFTDPATIPPEEPKPDPTLIALDIEGEKAETERLSVEQRERDSQLDSETELEKTRILAEKDIAIALIKQGGATDLESLRAELRDAPILRNNRELEDMRGLFEGMQSEITENLAQLIQGMNAPKEIVRDEQGNIIGTRPVSG